MQTTKPLLLGATATVFLVASLLTGCSDNDGNGFDPSGQEGTTPGGTGKLAVPKVPTPLNVEPFLNRPCALVDEKTVAEVGEMATPEEDASSERAKKLVGPNCTWLPKERGPYIGLEIHTVHREYAGKGIGGVYASHESGVIDYLEPVEIPGHPGYPAVFAGQQGDKEAHNCPLSLGVADDLEIAIRVNDASGTVQDTCPLTVKVAASVLQTLKTGS